MIHELKFLVEYVVILFQGVARLYFEFGKWCLRIVANMPHIEKAFFFLTATEALLALQKWKSYEFLAGENSLVHGIYSDDFVYFLFLNGLLLLGAFRYAPQLIVYSALTPLWRVLRFGALAGMSFFYLLNLLSSERIAPAPEAEFTLWFIMYGVVLAVLWIIGILGIEAMPRIREDGPLPSARSHR